MCQTSQQNPLIVVLWAGSVDFIQYVNLHNYTKASDGSIDVPTDSKYNPGTSWEFGRSFNGFAKKGNPADMITKQVEGNANAIASPLLGFNLDTTPIKTKTAQLQAVLDEFHTGIAT